MKVVTPEGLQEQRIEPHVPVLGRKRHQQRHITEVEIRCG
jgi:hypothetical protein